MLLYFHNASDWQLLLYCRFSALVLNKHSYLIGTCSPVPASAEYASAYEPQPIRGTTATDKVNVDLILKNNYKESL